MLCGLEAGFLGCSCEGINSSEFLRSSFLPDTYQDLLRSAGKEELRLEDNFLKVKEGMEDWNFKPFDHVVHKNTRAHGEIERSP